MQEPSSQYNKLLSFVDLFRLETVFSSLWAYLKKHKAVLFASFLSAGMAYMFLFTNKLVNHDDILALFDLGTGISSGRWMIDLLAKLTITGSMPWLNGVTAVFLLALANCALVDLLEIKSPFLQILLSAAMMVFPGQMDVFCYMFTSTAYALAQLFSVLAVFFYRRGGKAGSSAGVLFAVLSLGIYQSYIALSSSLLLLLLIKDLAENEKSGGQIFLDGLKSLFFLLVTAAVYFALTELFFVVFHSAFNTYGSDMEAKLSFFGRIIAAYGGFIEIFSKNRMGLINNPYSALAHLLCALFLLLWSLWLLFRFRDWKKGLLLLLCLALLPLSMNAMFLFFEGDSIRAMMSFGFTGFYAFIALAAEHIIEEGLVRTLSRQLLLWMLTLIIVNNVCVLNRTSLMMHLAYENAYSFFTTVLSDIFANPSFDENCKIALIGYTDTFTYPLNEVGDTNVQGALKSLKNVYSRTAFIQYYLGFFDQYADEQEQWNIVQTDEFKEMPLYPYYGSVRRIGDYMVVKLGETPVPGI